MAMLNSRSRQTIVMSGDICGKLVQTLYMKRGDPWVHNNLISRENIRFGSIFVYNCPARAQAFRAYLQQYGTNPKEVYSAGTEESSHTLLKMIVTGQITPSTRLVPG
jgi:hypothetical protein